MSNPAVSVCVPLYNKERYIGETVRSVLDQTYDDLELVVLDNASTDGSAAVVRTFRDPRIRLARNPTTSSPIENFNACVSISGAPLVKVLCADDLLHPECIRHQVAALHADSTLSMVTCRQHVIDESGCILARDRCLRKPDLIGRQSRTTVVRRLIRHGGNPIGNPGNVLFRRSAFDAVGGFPADEAFFTVDVSLWINLLEQGHYLGLPETLTSFRLDAGSDSRGLGGEAVRVQRQFIKNVRDENASIVRRRDTMFSAARAPLTNLRQRMLIAAADGRRSPQTWAARQLISIARRTPEG